MGTFLKKHFVLISILFLALFMLSAWKFPTAAQAVLIAFVGFSLWAAISSIVVKHQVAYREGKLTRFAFRAQCFSGCLWYPPGNDVGSPAGQVSC